VLAVDVEKVEQEKEDGCSKISFNLTDALGSSL